MSIPHRSLWNYMIQQAGPVTALDMVERVTTSFNAPYSRPLRGTQRIQSTPRLDSDIRLVAAWERFKRSCCKVVIYF